MFVDQELVTVKSKWQSVNKIPCSSPSLACVDVTLLTTCTACDSVCVVFYHLRDALQVKLQVQTVREVFFKFWKMLSSMWIQGENVHWMSHFKDQLQAILFLQYACNLANTSNLWIQSIKRVGLLTISHITPCIFLLSNNQHLILLFQEWATLS